MRQPAIMTNRSWFINEHMITGKLTPAVWERSVERMLRRNGVWNSENGRSGKVTGVSSGTLGGAWDRTVGMILSDAAGQVLENLGEPSLFALSLTVPAQLTEEQLRQVIQTAGDGVRKWDALITAVDCRVSQAVVRPVLQAVCTGSPYEDAPRNGAEDGWLVMAAGPGEGGAAWLCRHKENELKRFPGSLLRETAGLMEGIYLKAVREVLREPSVRQEILGMQCVAGGGVFASLWHLAGKLSCGFEADLRRMPIRQEVIEVCEAFNVHPYRLNGQGAVLFVTGEPDKLIGQLFDKGMEASLIGKVSGKAVTIRNGEELRYLEKPQQEELDRLADNTPVRP